MFLLFRNISCYSVSCSVCTLFFTIGYCWWKWWWILLNFRCCSVAQKTICLSPSSSFFLNFLLSFVLISSCKLETLRGKKNRVWKILDKNTELFDGKNTKNCNNIRSALNAHTNTNENDERRRTHFSRKESG